MRRAFLIGALVVAAVAVSSAASALGPGSPITLKQARAAFTSRGYRLLPSLFPDQPRWRLQDDEVLAPGAIPRGYGEDELRVYISVYWAKRDIEMLKTNKHFIVGPYMYRDSNVVLILDPRDGLVKRRQRLAVLATLGRIEHVS